MVEIAEGQPGECALLIIEHRVWGSGEWSQQEAGGEALVMGLVRTGKRRRNTWREEKRPEPAPGVKPGLRGGQREI